MSNICITPGCGKVATLRCPTCLDYGVNSSYFCEQACFKSFWKEHKVLHKVFASETSVKGRKEPDDAFTGYNFTGTLRPGEKTPMRKVPKTLMKPDYAESGIPISETQAKNNQSIVVLTEAEIEGMRLTSRFAREVLDIAVDASGVGVTTEEIDRIVHEACLERECYPSPLNYFNFPKSCCTSINEVICHGIPDSRPLKEGDILNIDITTYFRGFHGDLNETIFVGKPSDDDIRLVKCAYDCLAVAMDIVAPGARYRDAGDVITKRASQDNFSVVRTYCGHGVHKLFHCPPNVPHYSMNKAVGLMKVGHCFTIEPMINAGVWSDQLWPDQWTAVTKDGKKSSQFEHTMIVTKSEDPRSCAATCPDKSGPPIEVVTKRELKGEDQLASAMEHLEPIDRKHFALYGRPHFVDQLHKMGYKLSECFQQKKISERGSASSK